MVSREGSPHGRQTMYAAQSFRQPSEVPGNHHGSINSHTGSCSPRADAAGDRAPCDPCHRPRARLSGGIPADLEPGGTARRRARLRAASTPTGAARSAGRCWHGRCAPGSIRLGPAVDPSLVHRPSVRTGAGVELVPEHGAANRTRAVAQPAGRAHAGTRARRTVLRWEHHRGLPHVPRHPASRVSHFLMNDPE